ncbi:Hypothetical_protein [Hexamita inflata]|uniref:Hypothetical_protein n=1 Tax=Hexamita inflata TaxID=28002 RepID=A0AA86QQZ8_9EUKA|nr:Hypothetical protein HINF_LOCUS50615 [Hexamita inflata]
MDYSLLKLSMDENPQQLMKASIGRTSCYNLFKQSLNDQAVANFISFQNQNFHDIIEEAIYETINEQTEHRVPKMTVRISDKHIYDDKMYFQILDTRKRIHAESAKIYDDHTNMGFHVNDIDLVLICQKREREDDE